MKKIILVFAAVLLASVGWSQTVNIHFKNGQSVQFYSNGIEYIEFTEATNNNATVTSGDAVDLGLSVKWASCNVGATLPEEFGDIYAWGETTTKDNYSLETYIFYDMGTQSYMDIGKDIGGTDFDVAHVKWGEQWRMPTFDETKELRENCSWRWSKINEVFGYVVTGANGNSIFFPVNEKSNFWASDIFEYEKNKAQNTLVTARCLGLSNTKVNTIVGTGRYNGCFVRPVTSK